MTNYGTPQPAWAGPPLADFGKRLVGGLIDFIGPSVIAFVLYLIFRPLGILAYIAAVGYTYIYKGVMEANTGQSFGKQVAGVRLVSEETGQNLSVGQAIGRNFVHLIDAIICYIGFLFPLWDAKRQTIADKIMKTVVVVS